MSLGTILVTGGAGYIGSHTCVALLQAGYEVVIYDNLSNSHQEVINRIQAITQKRPVLVVGDIRDQASLVKCMQTYQCSAVMHFAGVKAVGESYADPALANQLLHWKTTKTLDIMCADHWHWQQKNPQGYES